MQDIVFMYLTHPYPYVRALLEPSGETIRMFIKENGIKSVRVAKTLWSTTLELKYPAILKFYGKCKEIIVNHEYPWSKRIPSFKPGLANYLGYVIKHPQTAFLVLYAYPRGSFDVDHANPRPVFRLEHAPGDYFLAPIPLSVALKTANPTKELPIILKLSTTLDHTRAALAEALRGKKEWHSRCIRAEEALEGTDVETKSLLEERTDRVAGAIRYMLALREDQLTIENALKHYKKFSLTFSKWLALTVCFLGGLGFLYVGRDSLGGMGGFLNDPANMIFALLVALAVCVVLYYGLVKKGGGK